MNLPVDLQNQSFEKALCLAHAHLSLRARLGHVLLLLVAAAMSVVVGSLWATEPALPLRTQLAFAALLLIGMFWVGHAAWVLSARRPLLAQDRVLAGAMAMGFAAAFTLAAVLVAVTRDAPAAWLAALQGVTLLLVAFEHWRRSRRLRAALLARRALLEAN